MRKVALSIAASVIALAASATGLSAQSARGPRANETGMMAHHEMMMRVVMILIDADGDGAVSSEELQGLVARIFNAVDLNKDGKLTPDEMQALLQSGSATEEQ
jgi:hypothetical protein